MDNFPGSGLSKDDFPGSGCFEEDSCQMPSGLGKHKCSSRTKREKVTWSPFQPKCRVTHTPRPQLLAVFSNSTIFLFFFFNFNNFKTLTLGTKQKLSCLHSYFFSGPRALDNKADHFTHSIMQHIT